MQKNIVANKYAYRCELQGSYAIGMKELEDEIIKEKFELIPMRIIEYLDLQKQVCKKGELWIFWKIRTKLRKDNKIIKGGKYEIKFIRNRWGNSDT